VEAYSLLLFLGVTGFSISRSKKRLKTVFYTLAAMALTLGLMLGIAEVVPAFNNAPTGVATIDLMLLVGMLTALIHSRKSGKTEAFVSPHKSELSVDAY
jgi:hypothetical protein